MPNPYNFPQRETLRPFRPGSKLESLLALLARPEGASFAECQAVGFPGIKFTNVMIRRIWSVGGYGLSQDAASGRIHASGPEWSVNAESSSASSGDAASGRLHSRPWKSRAALDSPPLNLGARSVLGSIGVLVDSLPQDGLAMLPPEGIMEGSEKHRRIRKAQARKYAESASVGGAGGGSGASSGGGRMRGASGNLRREGGKGFPRDGVHQGSRGAGLPRALRPDRLGPDHDPTERVPGHARGSSPRPEGGPEEGGDGSSGLACLRGGRNRDFRILLPAQLLDRVEFVAGLLHLQDADALIERAIRMLDVIACATKIDRGKLQIQYPDGSIMEVES